jgi:hypothetical protein
LDCDLKSGSTHAEGTVAPWPMSLALKASTVAADASTTRAEKGEAWTNLLRTNSGTHALALAEQAVVSGWEDNRNANHAKADWGRRRVSRRSGRRHVALPETRAI